MSKNKVFQQDLSQKEQAGSACPIHLFFKEKVKMPDKDAMTAVMEKHIGETECFSYDKGMAGFLAKNHIAKFKDGSMPITLMVTECLESEDYHMDELVRSQMWDCPESEEILAQCQYHAIAVDILGGAVENYKERADLLMDFMEALVELYPDCMAVQFQNSGKMFAREKIVNHKIPREDRFIYFAVNVRFFNIQGTPDMMVDTLGMSTLYLPDLQYHFHDMDPNWVVNHAYNMLSYIYANNAPIGSGETIDGIKEGSIDGSVRWRCQYENALIQPAREVIDVYMNEYASGKREDKKS